MGMRLCLIVLKFLKSLLKSLENRYKTFSLLDINFRFTCDKSKLDSNVVKFQIIALHVLKEIT